jgi:Zn-dependent protease
MTELFLAHGLQGLLDPGAPGGPMQQTAVPERTFPASPVDRRDEGWKAGRVLGLDVRLDWSITILFVLLLVDLGTSVFPNWHRDWSPELVWGLAVATAVLFVVSVALHELAHALVARLQNIPVRHITLFVFGGVTELEHEPKSAGAEFAMAVVGPLLSILIGLGATALGLQWTLRGYEVTPDNFRILLSSASPAATLLLWLGSVNVTLGLFNLLPGFPMDGGRVFRAVVWAATGDRRRATRWAAGAGRVIATVFMILGVFTALRGGLVGGLWLLLIGWFLTGAARSAAERSLFQETLAALPVTRLMRTDVVRLTGDLPVDVLVQEHLVRAEQHVFPVVGDDDVLLGFVSGEEVRALPAVEWATTPISKIMTPLDSLRSLGPDAHMDQAFERLSRQDEEDLPIVDRGRLLGIVHRADMMRFVGLLAR